MLEKQNLYETKEFSSHFTLEPEVQIKEEKEFLKVPFCGVKIKKEIEETIELNDIKNEIIEYKEIKVEREDSSDEGVSEDKEITLNCLIPDVLQKANKEAQDSSRKQSSSLSDKVAVFSDNPADPDFLRCRKCHLNFKSKADLLNHDENHMETLFKCSQCHMVFNQGFSLRIHQAFHGTLRRHKCEICGKMFTRKSTLKDHLLSHSGKKPYQCDVCKKFYRSKMSLISHFRYHSQDKKYECPVCKKLFFQPSGLSGHLATHRNAKDFKCDICSKHFSYQSTLKRHIKSHFGTQKYPCDECDKFFRQNSSLRVHKQIKHLGLRPFKCEDCDKAFTKSWSLKLHMNTHRVLQVPKTIKIITQEKNG